MSLQQLREKIVNEIPISELIQRYGVLLTRKSSNHMGVCPFHADSNPSMSVSDEKRIYKCFACGAGTTHFDFVMNLNSLSFVESLKDICEKFGIDFDSYTDKKEKSQELVYAEKITKAASEIYHQIGMKSHPQEFTEFMKKREIPDNLVKEYKLGFAPKKNTILNYISTLPKKDQQGVLNAAIETGLVKIDRERQSHYDTFRDRIMFPIWDHYGKIIGFTSRAIHDYQKAKYMNSKESLIFNKRNLLYGLHLAKPFIRKRDSVLLVEGNMDQVSAFRKGFEHSVAIMGTALGDNSLRTLKSLTKNITLALDSDNAGMDASIRINKMLLAAGIIPKYVEFSPHKDPDDFLIAEGSIALQTKIDTAKPFIDFQFDQLCPDQPIELIDTKLKLLQDAFEIVSPLKKDLKATERLIKWAERLGLKSASDKILEDYGNFLSSKDSQGSQGFSRSAQPQQKSQQPSNQQNIPEYAPYEMGPPPSILAEEEIQIQEYLNEAPPAIEMPNDTNKISKVEEILVMTLIEYPNCLEYDEMSDLLDFMGSDRVKEYVLKLREIIFEIDIKEFKNFALAIAKDFDLEELVNKAVAKYTGLTLDAEKAKKMIVDLGKNLIKENLREKKAELRIKRMNVRTEDELTTLMIEIHGIEKKLHSLK